MTAILLISAALGYLLGSIPFGLVVTRLAGEGDIRKIGSGNIGTTNVLRTGRKELAILTLLGDSLKATVAALVAGHFGGEVAALVAGSCAFVGHVFPVWLRFKGGKGVATYLGALIGIVWQVALVFAAVWIVVAFTTRYSSASALAASVVAPVALAILGWPLVHVIVFAAMSVILWTLHRENIARLLSGKESRIGQSAPASRV